MKKWEQGEKRKRKRRVGSVAGVTCRGLCAEWSLAGRGGWHSWLGSPAAITSWYQRSKSSLGIWGLSRSSWLFSRIGTQWKVEGWNETRKWGKEEKEGKKEEEDKKCYRGTEKLVLMRKVDSHLIHFKDNTKTLKDFKEFICDCCSQKNVAFGFFEKCVMQSADILGLFCCIKLFKSVKTACTGFLF